LLEKEGLEYLDTRTIVRERRTGVPRYKAIVREIRTGVPRYQDNF